MVSTKNLLLAVLIACIFLPIAVFSPEAVSNYIVSLFGIRYPEPPPQRVATGKRELADAIQAMISE